VPLVPGAPPELEPAAPLGLPLPALCAQANGVVASSVTRPRETMLIAIFIGKTSFVVHAARRTADRIYPDKSNRDAADRRAVRAGGMACAGAETAWHNDSVLKADR
jgi:hypothetical protein